MDRNGCIIEKSGTGIFRSCMAIVFGLSFSASAFSSDAGLSALHFFNDSDEVVILVDRAALGAGASDTDQFVSQKRFALYMGDPALDTTISATEGTPSLQVHSSGSGSPSLLVTTEDDSVSVHSSGSGGAIMVHGSGSGAYIQVHSSGSGAGTQVHSSGSGALDAMPGTLWGIFEVLVSGGNPMIVLYQLTDSGLEPFFVAELDEENQWQLVQAFD